MHSKLTQNNNCPSLNSALSLRQKDEDCVLASLSPFGVPLHSLFSLLPNETLHKSMARDKHKSPVEVTYRKQFEPAHLALGSPAQPVHCMAVTSNLLCLTVNWN